MGQVRFGWSLSPDGVASIMHVTVELDLDGVADRAEARGVMARLLTEPIVKQDAEELRRYLDEAELKAQLGL